MLEYLLPYLLHGLKVQSIGIFEGDPIFEMSLESAAPNKAGVKWIIQDEFKPLLHPLNSFTRFEEVLDEMSDWEIQNLSEKLEFGAEPIDGYCGKINYKAVQTMFKNHLDVFNLIPKNLAIEINTLK